MKFFHHLLNKHDTFNRVQGYDDLKEILSRALDTEHNYNLLFIGPPASSKTLFLQGILEIRKDAVYFDGSNTTNRILDVLEEKRPKIILLDELDKMGKSWQNQLLNFMESGRVDVEQQRKQYHFEKERKYLPRAMRLTGYPSRYSQGSGSSSYPDIQKNNS
jgi:MoxR-like ATPase